MRALDDAGAVEPAGGVSRGARIRRACSPFILSSAHQSVPPAVDDAVLRGASRSAIRGQLQHDDAERLRSEAPVEQRWKINLANLDVRFSDRRDPIVLPLVRPARIASVT